MRKLLFIVISCLIATHLSAQSKFMPELQSQKAGEGKVTVIQDPRLTDIINNDIDAYPEIAKVEEQKENTKVEGMGAITEGRRMKVRGYRIQVYWGGSQRSDQTKAIRAGSRVTSMFPELQAYTTFESPHWRCRVGDFRERKEAADYLAKLRKAKIEGAMVVKSEILVYPK